MISRIEVSGYRALRHADVQLGRFHVLVGPNGAGKTTFLDVASFVGDVLRVGPQRAIEGDAATRTPFRASDLKQLLHQQQGEAIEFAIELELPAALGSPEFPRARYEIAVGFGAAQREVAIRNESLWLCPDGERSPPPMPELFPRTAVAPESILRVPRQHVPPGWRKVVQKVFESGNDSFSSEIRKWTTQFRVGSGRSALASLPEDEREFPAATWVRRTLLEGARRVVLDAEAMRRPASPISPRAFLPDGSNLPIVVHDFRRDHPTQFKDWLGQVRTAIPEIADVDTLERPEDRHKYIVVTYESGLRAPAWTISDGTLRLLALTLIGFVPGLDGLYLIEEPENGVHPKAVETVFQSLRTAPTAQIWCASHSPVLLRLASPETVLCFAKAESGAADVVRGAEHPRLRQWSRSIDLGDLFAAGVLG